MDGVTGAGRFFYLVSSRLSSSIALLTRVASEGRSSAELASCVIKDANSHHAVITRMGRSTVPLWEDGWIPYCLPCIVHYLTGYTTP